MPATSPFRTLRGVLAIVLLSALAWLAGGTAAAAAEVHTTASDNRSGEQVKTLPIAKRAWSKPRSVISLSPGAVGPIRAGDRVEAFGDIEVSVCLKPNSNHGGAGHPCVGKLYGYNPTVRARVVLAAGADDAQGSRTVPVTATRSLTCSQKQPDRNHHCVLSIPWQGISVPDPSRLPCSIGSCRLNLIMSASDRKARAGHKVVIGSTNENGRIKQGKGKLSAVVYSGGDKTPERSFVSRKPATRRAPVAASNGRRTDVVVRSLPLGGLRAGDQLVVDAETTIGIGHLPYNALVRSELIITDSPRSTSSLGNRAGNVADSTTRIATENGFNCTLGRSAHTDACQVRKGGILSIRKGSAKPLYANLIVSLGAKGTETMYRKWKPSDRARVGKGFIRAEQYEGTSSCTNCQTDPGSAALDFSPTKLPPAGTKKRKLVDQLRGFGILSGRLECINRSDPKALICRWSAAGSFGIGRRYECSSKAEWTGRSWRIGVCKDALGAQLWHLLQERGIQPTYAGSCAEKPGKFVCSWNAKGVFPDGEAYFCRGNGTYEVSTHRWRIDPCRNEREFGS